MITEEEKNFLESARRDQHPSKLTARRLALIWNSHHAEKLHSCFCSATERKQFQAKFFQWFEQNLMNDNSTTE
jgi:hypothetical protein